MFQKGIAREYLFQETPLAKIFATPRRGSDVYPGPIVGTEWFLPRRQLRPGVCRFNLVQLEETRGACQSLTWKTSKILGHCTTHGSAPPRRTSMLVEFKNGYKSRLHPGADFFKLCEGFCEWSKRMVKVAKGFCDWSGLFANPAKKGTNLAKV